MMPLDDQRQYLSALIKAAEADAEAAEEVLKSAKQDKETFQQMLSLLNGIPCTVNEAVRGTIH